MAQQHIDTIGDELQKLAEDFIKAEENNKAAEKRANQSALLIIKAAVAIRKHVKQKRAERKAAKEAEQL